MTTTTFRKLWANLKSYFDSVDENKDILIVPRNGDRDAIIIMALSEYNSIVETEYLLSTEANRNMLEQSLNELENDETVEFRIVE